MPALSDHLAAASRWLAAHPEADVLSVYATTREPPEIHLFGESVPPPAAWRIDRFTSGTDGVRPRWTAEEDGVCLFWYGEPMDLADVPTPAPVRAA